MSANSLPVSDSMVSFLAALKANEADGAVDKLPPSLTTESERRADRRRCRHGRDEFFGPATAPAVPRRSSRQLRPSATVGSPSSPVGPVVDGPLSSSLVAAPLAAAAAAAPAPAAAVPPSAAASSPAAPIGKTTRRPAFTWAKNKFQQVTRKARVNEAGEVVVAEVVPDNNNNNHDVGDQSTAQRRPGLLWFVKSSARLRASPSTVAFQPLDTPSAQHAAMADRSLAGPQSQRDGPSGAPQLPELVFSASGLMERVPDIVVGDDHNDDGKEEQDDGVDVVKRVEQDVTDQRTAAVTSHPLEDLVMVPVDHARPGDEGIMWLADDGRVQRPFIVRARAALTSSERLACEARLDERRERHSLRTAHSLATLGPDAARLNTTVTTDPSFFPRRALRHAVSMFSFRHHPRPNPSPPPLPTDDDVGDDDDKDDSMSLSAFLQQHVPKR